MHDCQKFREDWIADAVTGDAGCEDCRRFCQETTAMFQAMDAAAKPVPEISESDCARLEGRLRVALAGAYTGNGVAMTKWLPLAAAAAIVIAVTGLGLRTPKASTPAAHIEFVDDHIKGLDPDVVDFLRRSELYVRSFTKLEPSYAADIEDAREGASRALEVIGTRRSAAGDFAPVRIALDEYESVLREIKNLDSPESIGDIQKRIHRNGLIASLKAYQPRMLLVSQR